MPQETLLLAALLLAVTALGASVAALLSPKFGRADPLQQRVERLASTGAAGVAPQARARHGKRRKSVRQTLKEIEEAQRQRGRRTLRLRLRQAGLGWSRRVYILLCAGSGLGAFLVLLLAGLGPYVSLGFAVAAGVGLPEFALRTLRLRRLRQMEQEFPNAIDVIVRGVKSGLPLQDCLRIIANESREPLRSEFGKIARDQAVGLSAQEAIDRFAQRVPLSEANFFSIVIAIQSRTGGSLSESLTNLSTVLRERKKMRGKIRAFSAEAKASAGIIGALPFVVTVAIYVTSPDYMRLLFETLIGQMVIGAAAAWMLIGILVMRRMINFEI